MSNKDRLIMVTGYGTFEDPDNAEVGVVLLDDRIISWFVQAGYPPTDDRDLLSVAEGRGGFYINDLSTFESAEVLAETLGAKIKDVQVGTEVGVKFPRGWNFYNNSKTAKVFNQNPVWDIVDFADFVNMKATGRHVIPWD